MEASPLTVALAVVALVLGSQLSLLFLLWYVFGHQTKVHMRVLRNQERLEKRLWLSDSTNTTERAHAMAHLAAATEEAPDGHDHVPQSNDIPFPTPMERFVTG